MFCGKCGARSESGIKFCSSCGEAVQGRPSIHTSQSTASQTANNQLAKKTNHRLVGLIACAAVLLIVIIGVIAIFSSGDANLDRRLVGRWEWTEWHEDWIELRRDGTGTQMHWGEEELFTWETENNSRLRLHFEGERGGWLPYEIDGNMLRITDQWNTVFEYRRIR